MSNFQTNAVPDEAALDALEKNLAIWINDSEIQKYGWLVLRLTQAAYAIAALRAALARTIEHRDALHGLLARATGAPTSEEAEHYAHILEGDLIEDRMLDESAAFIRQQAREIARLQGALADAANELPHVAGPIADRIRVYRAELQAVAERAEQERDALRADAERLDFVAQYCIDECSGSLELWPIGPDVEYAEDGNTVAKVSNWRFGDESGHASLRAAIDAARQAIAKEDSPRK